MKSFLSSCFHNFWSSVLCNIGDDLVSNDQTHFLRCKLCSHVSSDRTRKSRKFAEQVFIHVCWSLRWEGRHQHQVLERFQCFSVFNASTSLLSVKTDISPPLYRSIYIYIYIYIYPSRCSIFKYVLFSHMTPLYEMCFFLSYADTLISHHLTLHTSLLLINLWAIHPSCTLIYPSL